jgi:hypothetical protein
MPRTFRLTSFLTLLFLSASLLPSRPMVSKQADVQRNGSEY